MNRGHHLVHESSPVQQMMATGNPNCFPWSLNNNITPSTIAQFHEQKSQASVSPSSISPFYPAFSSSSVPLAPPHLPPPTTTAPPPPHHHHHQLLMNNMPSTLAGINSASSSSSLPFLGAAAASSFWGTLTAAAAADSNLQEHQFDSWNQLLMGAGLIMNGEEKAGQGLMNHHQFQTIKKTENWEDHHQALGIHQHQLPASPPTDHHSTMINGVDHVKQENSGNSSYVYGTSGTTTPHDCSTDPDFQAATAAAAAALKQITTSAAWSPHQQMMPVSSPQSCVTTFSNNNSLLDFSSPISDARHPPPQDRSSECNSTGNNTTSGGSTKRAKVQPSSIQSTIKVRKEKLGDRITALHQLVSPFGKTDTASVLLEALGYIRFLHNQIEALSLPYLTNNGSGNNNIRQPQTTVQQRERNSIFPEEPGQLLNSKCLKRKGGPDALQESQGGEKNDLKSRGLCLVPISCTLLVGSDNGADYWAPASSPLGPGFR